MTTVDQTGVEMVDDDADDGEDLHECFQVASRSGWSTIQASRCDIRDWFLDCEGCPFVAPHERAEARAHALPPVRTPTYARVTVIVGLDGAPLTLLLVCSRHNPTGRRIPGALWSERWRGWLFPYRQDIVDAIRRVFPDVKLTPGIQPKDLNQTE
jgi:hypothetical protein